MIQKPYTHEGQSALAEQRLLQAAGGFCFRLACYFGCCPTRPKIRQATVALSPTMRAARFASPRTDTRIFPEAIRLKSNTWARAPGFGCSTKLGRSHMNNSVLTRKSGSQMLLGSEWQSVQSIARHDWEISL